MTKTWDRIYPEWVIPHAVGMLNRALYLSGQHSIQCDICKGFYRVPKYIGRLHRCSECAALSYSLQRKAGRVPDMAGHFSETFFP